MAASGMQNTPIGVRQGGSQSYRDAGGTIERMQVAPVTELFCVTADLAFGAAGGVAVLGTLPPTAIPLKVEAFVATAFNAGTTNTLVIGTAGTPNLFVASGVLNPASATLQAAGLATVPSASGITVQATYGQTGTAATAGRARITLFYALP